MSLIHSAFSTRVNFNGYNIMCTDFQMDDSTTIIQSSSGYGGSLVGESMAIGTPYLLDYGEVSGSISYEPDLTQLQDLIAWITERNQPRRLVAYTGENGEQVYEECYFTSITINCSEDSPLTVSVNLWAHKNAFQDGVIGGLAPKTFEEDPAFITDMIPYWSTQLSGIDYDSVINWTITLSQDLNYKYFCEGLTVEDAPSPKYVIPGILNAELAYNIIASKEQVNVADLLYDYENSATLRVQGNDIMTMTKLVTQNQSPQQSDASSYVSLDLSYNVLGLSI